MSVTQRRLHLQKSFMKAQQTSLEFSFRMFKNLNSSLGSLKSQRRLTQTALSWKLGEWGFYTDWDMIFGKLLTPLDLHFLSLKYEALFPMFSSLPFALENTYFLLVTVPPVMTRLEVTLLSAAMTKSAATWPPCLHKICSKVDCPVSTTQIQTCQRLRGSHSLYSAETENIL